MSATNIPPRVAAQLARLRELRTTHAETQARAALYAQHAAQTAREQTAQTLEQHRASWRKAEARHRDSLVDATVHSYELHNSRARLDAIADRAYALQRELEKDDTALNAVMQDAEAARTHAARMRQARDQAQTLASEALDAEEAMQTAQEEDELDELIQMRARRKQV